MIGTGIILLNACIMESALDSCILSPATMLKTPSFIGTIFCLPIKCQLPIIRYRILPDDIGGIIVSYDLEITVIRPYPLVLNLFDPHHQGIELDTAGCFIDPVSGIAFYSDFHVI